jgi:hypothetical protein
MSIRCKYTAYKRGGVLLVIDENEGMSVTNDVENVICDLIEKGLMKELPPLIYRDSEGWYDGIAWNFDLLKNEVSVEFIPIRTKIQDVATQMAIGFRRQGRL